MLANSSPCNHTASDSQSFFFTKQNELAALQLQLARLKTTSPAEEDSTSTQELLREKQKAERRLQRIIRRCELCVQRHQILKEMGIRGKRGH